MKIVILTAMDKELNLITSLLDNLENNVTDLALSHGKIGRNEIYVGKCGIGKVNAAVNTWRIIHSLSPDLIINSGVAGGAGIPIGTVLVADRVAYDDVWCGPGTTYGEADGCPLFFSPYEKVVEIAQNSIKNNVAYGLICSGDKFISTPEEIAFIRSYYPEVMAVDMESAAISQVCYLTGTPFNIVRVVSDTPGEGENIEQYKNFWTEAPQRTFEVVKTIIENL